MWDWMKGMDVYYLKCLVGISFISLMILLIRFLVGKRLSKRFAYGMWIAIPMFVLLAPFVRIPMPQVMVNLGQETWEKLEGEVYTIIIPEDAVPEGDTLTDAIQSGKLTDGNGMGSEAGQPERVPAENPKAAVKGSVTLAKVLVALYGLVVWGFLVGIVSTNVRFEHKCRHNRVYLRETPKSKLPVYCLEGITSPFLLCATMYVPNGLTEDELKYAMLHEEGHFKHGDFFWVIIRYLILAVFFYNPIIWLAFRYSGYDCEMACDESVMKRIKVAEHKAYGSCLLDVIKKHWGIGQRVLLSTNMKSHKKLIRARIENIVSGRKNSVWVACLAALAVLLVTGFSFMEQKADGNLVLATAEEEDEAQGGASGMLPSEEEVREVASGMIPSKEEVRDSENKQSPPQDMLLPVNDDVVDYGDTVYFCAELMKKTDENCYENIVGKHELSVKINKDFIFFEKNESLTMEMIAYVAREAVGKKKGDTIQLIREIDGEEYCYSYFITVINDNVGLYYEFPKDWDYQFPEPVVGQFYNAEKWGPDFGFDGRELETGCFFVPYMREYYTTATASSYLKSNDKNGYHPLNVTDLGKMFAWAEGVEGNGIGETIELRQMYMGPGADLLTYTRFCIVNGYTKNKDIWEKNARVKELKVYYGETYVGSIHLKDCMEPQYIDVSALNMRVCNGREAVFTFEIADIYPGTKYDDTCLSGILMEFSR